MDDELRDYHVYMLRLWRTKYKGQWRASLESPYRGQRQSFVGLGRYFTFLRELSSSRAASMPDPGKDLKDERIGAE